MFSFPFNINCHAVSNKMLLAQILATFSQPFPDYLEGESDSPRRVSSTTFASESLVKHRPFQPFFNGAVAVLFLRASSENLPGS